MTHFELEYYVVVPFDPVPLASHISSLDYYLL